MILCLIDGRWHHLMEVGHRACLPHRTRLRSKAFCSTCSSLIPTKPVGKHKISVCTNLPCALSGGVHAGEHIKHKLGIDYRGTTGDDQFTLVEGECMGACGDAPVMLVNNKRMCSKMTDDKIDLLIEELKK
jgi:NADH-quinone oxidoreductase subunit E